MVRVRARIQVRVAAEPGDKEGTDQFHRNVSVMAARCEMVMKKA